MAWISFFSPFALNISFPSREIYVHFISVIDSYLYLDEEKRNDV